MINAKLAALSDFIELPVTANWATHSHWMYVITLKDSVKKSRDASFVEKNDKGQTVNRTNAIASVGSAAMDNEECYVYQKWLRSLGLVAIEHQARI